MDNNKIKPMMVSKELKLKYCDCILNTVFNELSIQVNFKDMYTALRIFNDLYNKGCGDLQLNYYNKTPNVYVKKDFLVDSLFKPDQGQLTF